MKTDMLLLQTSVKLPGHRRICYGCSRRVIVVMCSDLRNRFPGSPESFAKSTEVGRQKSNTAVC